jgi:hypothetical protein
LKRGWIAWDRNELPASVLNARLDKARSALAGRECQALVVYTDVWRSNPARYLTNFMPYWNRSLAVIPADSAPLLLCGLSARVYPWIKSVSNVEEIRPAGKLAEELLKLCSERSWTTIAVLDLDRLPHGIFTLLHASNISLVDLPSQEILEPGSDGAELSMRHHALKMAREILEARLADGRGKSDYEFTGLLERAFRRSGFEDLSVLCSDGVSVPAAARGVRLGEHYSLVASLEYRGHWVRLARPQTERAVADRLRAVFEACLRDFALPAGVKLYLQDLAGAYPYESCDASQARPGSIVSITLEMESHGGRWFYGDTCKKGTTGAAIL